MLETVDIPPSGDCDFSVIWLHGLGADGHDFEPLVPELALDGGRSVRFVFPHAPVRPVTLNGGYPMRAWFDIYSLDRDMRMDEDGIAASAADVRALIARENERGVPTGRIALAGFSQGGSLAMVTGLSHEQPLAGLIGLSCWVPQRHAAPVAAQRGTPVFLAHGSLDPVVRPEYGRKSRDVLTGHGMQVTYREYAMAHQVCQTEVAELRVFLSAIFRSST